MDTIVPVIESYFEIEDIPIDNVHIIEDINVDVNKDIGVEDSKFLGEAPSGEATNA